MGILAQVITNLGFSEENGLFFLSKKDAWSFLSPRIKHTINTIKPFAFYCIDDKPFILFFEKPSSEEEQLIHRQIWNSQTPIIIIETVSSVNIFNGYLFDRERHILEELTSNKHLDKFSFWNIISGNTWLEFEGQFKKKRLDEYLLENIQSVTEKLCANVPRPLATLLVLRLIFVRYLIDRGVDLNFNQISSDSKENAKLNLYQLVGNKEELYKLFDHLKESFNGNLFDSYIDPLDSTSEKDILNDVNLHHLQLFIGGNDVRQEQLVLFDFYDFNIIPVELVSNIYERFLGSQRRKEDGAFYTPSFIVDYILKYTIEPFLNENDASKVLDPACGSGIFLVETLRRIIENNLSKREFIESDNELSAYLTDNIYGIDKNEEAINVAIFSLYITLLDYKNPKELKGFNFPQLKGRNFIAGDFFDKQTIDAKLTGVCFDFIIGNPPWGSQPVDINDAHNYHSKYVDDTNKKYGCNLISDYQIAQSFLIRSRDFAANTTRCGFIITSKILYNTGASDFRKKFLLTTCSIDRILELSPVRFHLFKNAIAPCAVLLYSYENPIDSHRLFHQSLKPNIFLKHFQIIVSEKYDTKNILQRLLFEYDWLWKVLVYGNVLDFHFIKSYLANNNKFISMDEFMGRRNLISGAGFKVGKKNKRKSVSEIENLPVVRTNKFQPLYIDRDTLLSFKDEYPEEKFIDGIGMLAIYKAPHLLIKRGAKAVPVVAYAEYDCCFPNTIYGIVSPITEEGKNALKSIGTIISSSVISYFTFNLSPQWGIERDEVYLQDYRKIPFPNLTKEQCNDAANNFAKRTFEIADYYSHPLYPSSKPEASFDDIVYDVYDIDQQEEDLIDFYTKVSLPLFRNEESPYKRLSPEGFIPYVKVFIEHFEEIFNEDKKYFQVLIYDKIAVSHFAAIEIKVVSDRPQSIIKFVDSSKFSLDLSSKFSIIKHTQYFYEQKDVINYEKDSFFIIKPNEYKNWHPAVAQLDLGEIVDAFLSFNTDDDEH